MPLAISCTPARSPSEAGRTNGGQREVRRAVLEKWQTWNASILSGHHFALLPASIKPSVRFARGFLAHPWPNAEASASARGSTAAALELGSTSSASTPVHCPTSRNRRAAIGRASRCDSAVTPGQQRPLNPFRSALRPIRATPGGLPRRVCSSWHSAIWGSASSGSTTPRNARAHPARGDSSSAPEYHERLVFVQLARRSAQHGATMRSTRGEARE